MLTRVLKYYVRGNFMSIAETVIAIKSQQEGATQAKAQELEGFRQKGEQFIEARAFALFEETNRDVLMGKGRISKLDLPERIELVLEWDDNNVKVEDRKRYRLTIEAKISSTTVGFFLYPNEPIIGMRRKVAPYRIVDEEGYFDKDSDLAYQIAVCLANNECELPPRFYGNPSK